MITFTIGNILESSAQALVNTVNCEGYMGKGLAYQFKMRYPETNLDYIKACNQGILYIGTIHYYYENGKYIINFPTKNKWRADSKIEYIQIGLEQLKILIKKLNIKSIAIPPLGSGNGNLNWIDVKNLIVKSLSEISKTVEIIIYEPSKDYRPIPVTEPKLNMSALILMQIKNELNKFNSLRLQKTAYFINIFSHTNYFKFEKHKYGPYDNAIKIISKDIKMFQIYHGTKNSVEAYQILYNKLISESLEEKMKKLSPYVKQATEYVNKIETDKFLEGLSTVIYIIENIPDSDTDNIIKEFKGWSKDKALRFSDEYIISCIKYLYDTGVIGQTITGYDIL